MPAAMHDIWLHAHIHEHMQSIRRTRASVHTIHSVTHTNGYQVIRQMTGTNNVQILRKTARAANLILHPPRNYIIGPAARPASHIWSYPSPQPSPHWSDMQPAPHRNK